MEVKLSTLIPDGEDYLMRFRSLVTQLKGRGKTKLDVKCIFMILSKLKGPSKVLFSTFYYVMDALEDEFKMPCFDRHFGGLTGDRSKLSLEYVFIVLNLCKIYRIMKNML